VAPPVATPSVAPAPSTTGFTVAPDSTFGTLVPPPYAKGHRVFVDGRVAGTGASPISVSCGAHVVRIGRAGRKQSVTVPCGATVSLGR
jgi:hypothetical protein